MVPVVSGLDHEDGLVPVEAWKYGLERWRIRFEFPYVPVCVQGGLRVKLSVFSPECGEVR